MTQNREMIHVMGNRHIFNRQPTMRAIVHPPAVVRLHFEGVVERLGVAILREVLSKTFVTIGNHHGHHVL